MEFLILSPISIPKIQDAGLRYLYPDLPPDTGIETTSASARDISLSILCRSDRPEGHMSAIHPDCG